MIGLPENISLTLKIFLTVWKYCILFFKQQTSFYQKMILIYLRLLI